MTELLSDDTSEFSDILFENVTINSDKVSDKQFYNCQFKRCDFTDTEFNHCRFEESTFTDCNLSLLKVTGSKFRNVMFKTCKLIGIDWTRANWPNIQISSTMDFDECSLNDSSFFGLCLIEIKMEGCQIQGVDFSEANCEEASFIQSDLLNSRFNKTNLNKADFTDAVNYSINVFDNQVSKAKFSLPEATSLLASLDIEVLE